MLSVRSGRVKLFACYAQSGAWLREGTGGLEVRPCVSGSRRGYGEAPQFRFHEVLPEVD